jgi:hypothetical protein
MIGGASGVFLSNLHSTAQTRDKLDAAMPALKVFLAPKRFGPCQYSTQNKNEVL